MNANHASIGFAQPPIPEASITKVPSAELRPDQTDQDTLPPYEVLDRIVRGWVEDEQDVETIARAHGLDAALVARWTRAIELAEYKRRQAPIVPKLSARAFGPGRRMPVAARLRLP
jgi:NH3-dependent NAD+ synthetase